MLRGFTFRSSANRVQQDSKTSRRGSLPLRAAIRSCVEQLESRTLLSSYVIHISVDGLRPDAITTLGAADAPNFYRLRNEGAFTDNARADYDVTETLPNHTTQLTARPVLGTNGHSVSFNSDPGTTIHQSKGAYVPSVFDVVSDNGLRTGLYASKDKFAFFDRSWNEVNGALDTIGVDNGRDKIDQYTFNDSSQLLTGEFVADMSAEPFHYSLLHWRDPDTAGHASGWMSTAYLNAVKAMDGLLGQVLSLVTTNPTLAGKTNIVLTADHGGVGTGHGDEWLPEVYTLPFHAWGPDVTAGADLYQLNPASRTNPGTSRLDSSVDPQPIRHGDAANLALDLLGLGPVPTSLFNVQQDLSVRAPMASLIEPQDGGTNDMDPAPGSVKVNNAQPVFSVKVSAAGLGVNDTSVTASTVRMTKDGMSFTGYAFGYDGATDTIALTPTSGSFGTGSYEIHLSADSDKISDLDGYVMAATTLHINIDPSVVVEQTVSFEQGVSGYAGTVDTQLSENAPSTNNATLASLSVDNDDPSGSNKDTQVLLRFDAIFGTSAGQIPIGATISSATLELQITNVGSSINLHRMLRSWSATDTWNTLNAGVQADGVEALATADVSTGAIGATGKRSIDVTASLAAWLANPAGNLGWVLLPTGGDGVDFYSSEGTTRPRLVVQYIPGGTPTANGDAYSVAEDGTLNVAAPGVLANDSDPDADALTAVLVEGPANGGVTLNTNGSFSYIPNADFAGTDTFTYHAFDGISCSSPATVTITVNQVNDAPVAANDNYATNEDIALIVAAPGVLINDTDADGSALTATLVIGPTSGTLTFNPDGTFTYTPTLNFSGDDSFTYKVSDGVLTSEATVTLTINSVNDAPVAVDDTYAAIEDTGLSVTAAGVLTNDTDVEGNALTAVLVSGPANGSLTLNADGSFTYTPKPNFHGADSFTYQASDGSALGNVATVTLNVAAVNDDAPVAVNDNYSVDENAILTIAVPGVLANDSDPDGQTLSVTIESEPSHGAVNLSADGSFSYTPAAGYDGPDSFTYSASDGALSSNVATVTIDVKRTNAAPVATDDTYATLEDTPLSISAPGVLANDSDGDSDPLTAVLVAGPSNGTLTVNADGSFSYNPNANFNGLDSFTYQASDGLALSNVTTVTLSVAAGNDAPVAVDDSASMLEGGTINGVSVLANDSDVDGDVLTAELATLPAHGTLSFSSDGTYTYTPAAGFTGTDNFTYIARDAHGAGSSPAMVTLTVSPLGTDDVAITESTTFGTASGMSGVSSSDNIYETIVEQVYGGKKHRLSHMWEFNVTGGNKVTFYLEAHHNSNVENFSFNYSLDRAVWTSMLTVTKRTDDDSYQAFNLPASTAGRIWVQVVDTNGSDNSRDTIYIDHMFIRSLSTNPLPAVSIVATDTDASEAGGNAGLFTVTRTGDTSAPLVVDYSIGGAATNGDDYDALTGRIEIPAGSASATFSMNPIDDALDEGDETVIISLLSSSAYAVAGSSATATIVDDDVVLTAPADPSNLAAVAVSATQINLTWSDNSANEDGFRIERSIDGTNFTVLATVGADTASYSDLTVAASTTYQYRVQAHNTAGLSTFSDIASATTPAAGDTTAPSTPAGLTAIGTTADSISLSWTASTDNVGVTGYEIWRNGALLGTTTGTSYIDSGLAASTTYSYYVKAFDAANNVSGASNTADATTHAISNAPAAPSNLTGSKTQRTRAKLTWLDNSTDETAFYVYSSRDGVNWIQHATVAARNNSGGTVQYTTGSLALGTWYFRVSAVNDSGESFSNVVTVTV